jgi:hypothetical protein
MEIPEEIEISEEMKILLKKKIYKNERQDYKMPINWG